MFQALPQRQAKRPQHAHFVPAAAANDHHVANTATGGSSQARTDTALHCHHNSQQPCVASEEHQAAHTATGGSSQTRTDTALHRSGVSQQPVALREVSGKAQAATQHEKSSLKQPDSSTMLHSHHAFRLSFSPTGIPTVDSHQGFGTQATLSEPIQASALEPTQHQSPQTQPPGPEHHMATHAADRAATPASGSATNSHACGASATLTAVSQPSSGSAVPGAAPKATQSPHPAGAGTASPGRVCASKSGDGRHAVVQAEAHRLQQLCKDSPATADCSRHQAASTQSGSEAQVEAESVAMETASPAQPELPSGAQASAPAAKPVAQAAVQSVPPTVQPITQAMQEAPAHACTPVAGDAAHRLRSDTPCEAPCSILPSPSTPMLAWLDALSTPASSSLLSAGSQPSLGGQGGAAAHEVHVPFGSAVQAHMDKCRLEASPEPPSEAVPDVLSSPVVLAKVCTDPPHLSSSSSATDALSEKASSVPRAVPDQAMPGALPSQATPGPVPRQATPGPLPTPILQGNTQNGVQGTPRGWPRRATPHMGPHTGLSGLTTPASAAEMHRYVNRKRTLSTCQTLVCTDGLSICDYTISLCQPTCSKG